MIGTTARRRWTAEMDAADRRVYAAGGLRAVVAALGVTRSAAKNRARKLGLRRPARRWTAAEDAAIRTDYASGRATASEIAHRLGRGLAATRRRIARLGVSCGRTYTPAEIEAVRTRYAADGAKALAAELLGSATPENVWRMYRLAERLGVTVPTRHPEWVYDRVRELHARGFNDRQIAGELKDYFPGRNDRERVTAIRRRMGLPAIGQTPEQLREIGRRTRAAQIAAGVNPRDQAFAKFAAKYGLPADLPPRGVEIILALAGGPKTRADLETATGANPSSLWNAVGTTYLSGLADRGLVASAKLPGAAHRGPRRLYFLTAEAMDRLAGASGSEAANAHA